mgnify:CR=1 FL=1
MRCEVGSELTSCLLLCYPMSMMATCALGRGVGTGDVLCAARRRIVVCRLVYHWNVRGVGIDILYAEVDAGCVVLQMTVR